VVTQARAFLVLLASCSLLFVAGSAAAQGPQLIGRAAEGIGVVPSASGRAAVVGIASDMRGTSTNLYVWRQGVSGLRSIARRVSGDLPELGVNSTGSSVVYLCGSAICVWQQGRPLRRLPVPCGRSGQPAHPSGGYVSADLSVALIQCEGPAHEPAAGLLVQLGAQNVVVTRRQEGMMRGLSDDGRTAVFWRSHRTYVYSAGRTSQVPEMGFPLAVSHNARYLVGRVASLESGLAPAELVVLEEHPQFLIYDRATGQSRRWTPPADPARPHYSISDEPQTISNAGDLLVNSEGDFPATDACGGQCTISLSHRSGEAAPLVTVGNSTGHVGALGLSADGSALTYYETDCASRGGCSTSIWQQLFSATGTAARRAVQRSTPRQALSFSAHR
jgi:hypothetical protein